MCEKLIAVHKWSEAGMGQAPYSYIGVEDRGSMKNGSSCDYCGTGIRYLFWVRDAVGTRYKVGMDCIEKIGDTRLLTSAQNELRLLKKKQKEEADRIARDARIAKANALAAAKEAEEQAQRLRNGGLTDAQVAAKAKSEAIRAANAWILERLDMSDDANYWDGLRDLWDTKICDKSPRYQDVVCRIWSKTFGRANSKAYREAEGKFYDLIAAMESSSKS